MFTLNLNNKQNRRFFLGEFLLVASAYVPEFSRVFNKHFTHTGYVEALVRPVNVAKASLW